MRSSLRLGVLAVLLAASVSTAAQEDRERSVVPLNGAFLQFDSGNLDGDWKATWTRMTVAGMNTIFIQYLKFDNAEFIRTENDPTQRILELSDEHNRTAGHGQQVRVFIGLCNFGNWHGGRGKDVAETQQRMAAAKAASLALAGRVKERYGKYASFFGWYIPMEGDNCYDPDDAATLSAVHDLYRDIAQDCKRLLDKPVAASVFFNTENGGRNPAQTARAYTSILDGSGLQYLLVQDGVGERKWDDQVRARIGLYFQAFRTVCGENRIELWGVAECFRFSEKDANGVEQRIPLSDTARLKTQLQVMRSFGVKATVAFEFYTYLDPTPHAPDGDAGQKARATFYEDYVRSIVGPEPRP